MTGLRAARRGALLLVWGAVPSTVAAQSASGVAFVNATVVDVERGVLVPNQQVVTSGGRIERVGPMSVPIPAGRRRVDLRGAYVIPGLWDMHVHLVVPGASVRDLVGYQGSLLLAHGVTGVRDAGGEAVVLAAMDSAGRAGAAMPRLLYAGAKIAGPPGADDWGHWFADTLRSRLAAGATFGKLDPGVPPGWIRQVLGTCAVQGVRCVAHVPPADTSAWLNAPGRGSYEHLFNLAEHVSSRPATALFAEAREYLQPTLRQRVMYRLRFRKRPRDPDLTRLALRDTTRDRPFFARVAESGTWITPTLVLHQFMTGAEPLGPPAEDTTLSLGFRRPDARTAGQRQQAGQTWRLWMGLTRSLSSGGVLLLAGTDFFATHVPGAILHAELDLLQRAGVPAPDVLRMATINPARYLNALDTLGSVRAGRVADLVVLRRNPLEDIRHIAEIEMVMSRGQLLPRAALDTLLAGARRARGPVRAAIERSTAR